MSTTKSSLRVALVQCALLDNAPKGNMHHLEAELRTLAGQADLVVLPEVFTTGFSSDATAWADSWTEGEVLPWLIRLSLEGGFALSGSYLVKEGDVCYNRFVLVDGESVQWQDKRHLFSLGGEPDMLAPARERKILMCRGWRIMPLVCYDLRFPVWARCRSLDYDLIITVAAWPEPRRRVWQTLLKARAMENLAYCLGVNRIGKDKAGLCYVGDSVVLDPRGKELALAEEAEPCILRATLESEPLETLRAKFPVWQDADDYQLQIQ